MPQALLNSGTFRISRCYTQNLVLTWNAVKDDGLKNIMMSWYYAGYYTGLYEGQQKAHLSLQQGG